MGTRQPKTLRLTTACGDDSRVIAAADGRVSMFVTVGKASEIEDGEVTAFDVEGQTIAVANIGGKFYAFDDECTHEQCSLADGDLAENAVTCPCHGSQFDVATGAVLVGPAEIPLATYPLKIEGDDVMIEV